MSSGAPHFELRDQKTSRLSIQREQDYTVVISHFTLLIKLMLSVKTLTDGIVDNQKEVGVTGEETFNEMIKEETE